MPLKRLWRRDTEGYLSGAFTEVVDGLVSGLFSRLRAPPRLTPRARSLEKLSHRPVGSVGRRWESEAVGGKKSWRNSGQNGIEIADEGEGRGEGTDGGEGGEHTASLIWCTTP
jgi:hypothetical protein